MSRLVLVLLIALLLSSCAVFATPSLGEVHFPLARQVSVQVGGDIDQIAVGADWMAVHTLADKVIALDTHNWKTLWLKELPVSNFGTSFAMVAGKLIVASQERIALIDMQGHELDVHLSAINGPVNIIKVASVYPDYLFVIRSGDWNLEAYSLSSNGMLWRMPLGRGAGSVYYDAASNVAYVTSDHSVQAIDNSTGKALWTIANVPGQGAVYDRGTLYLPEPGSTESVLRLEALDAKMRQRKWEQEIEIPSGLVVSRLGAVSDLLIGIGSRGMIAVSELNGRKLWNTPDMGEPVYTVPIEVSGILYAKTQATGTVYAVSPKDGSILGYVRLENLGFDVAKGGIFRLGDGIVFNTKDSVVVYATR